MNLGLVIIKRLGVSHHGIQLTQSIRIKLARSSPLGATSFPLGGFLFLTNLGNAHDIPNRFDHRVNVMIRDKLDEFLVLLEFLHDRPNGLTKHIRVMQDSVDHIQRFNKLKLTGSQIGRQLPSRSEEHTSELQSLMRISYAVFCWKKKKNKT